MSDAPERVWLDGDVLEWWAWPLTGYVLASRLAEVEAERDRLAREVERMREALDRIAKPCAVSVTADYRVMYEAWRAICVERVDLARAALNPEGETSPAQSDQTP